MASLVAQREPWLERFLDCLGKLDYPEDSIRHAFLEGTKTPLLHEWAKQNTWIEESNAQISDRLERLAYLRNLLVDKALKDEDYILWIDSDVVDFPASLITDLKRHNAHVVAPGVWIEGTEQFYDTFAFRDIYGQRVPAFNLPYKGFVEMGSVGTCYLVNAAVYRKLGVRYSGGDSEQVTFCSEIRRLGQKVYADFDVRVLHANLPNYGVAFH